MRLIVLLGILSLNFCITSSERIFRTETEIKWKVKDRLKINPEIRVSSDSIVSRTTPIYGFHIRIRIQPDRKKELEDIAKKIIESKNIFEDVNYKNIVKIELKTNIEEEESFTLVNFLNLIAWAFTMTTFPYISETHTIVEIKITDDTGILYAKKATETNKEYSSLLFWLLLTHKSRADIAQKKITEEKFELLIRDFYEYYSTNKANAK